MSPKFSSFVTILNMLKDSREMVLGRTLMYLSSAKTPRKGSVYCERKDFVYENTDTLKTSKSSKISLSIMSVPDNPVPQLTFQEPVIDTYGEKGTTFYFRGRTVTYIEEVIPASSELYMVCRQDTTYVKGTKITSFLPWE